MPDYKDMDGKLHFLDDAKYEYLLPVGSVEISEEEADTIRQAEISAQEQSLESIESKLREIDLASIPSIREWIAKQPDAPQEILDISEQAAALKSTAATLKNGTP